jgi:hypothetical protein
MVISVLVPAVSFGIPMSVQIGVFMGLVALGALIAAPKKIQRLALALGFAFALGAVPAIAASVPSFVISCEPFCWNFCCFF